METAHIPHQLPISPEALRHRLRGREWADTPLFASLAEQWQAFGRAVPGQPDTEWNDLVRRPPE